MRDELQELEDDVMRMLIDGDDPVLAVLRIQFELAKRMPREMTGVGFFTHFQHSDGTPRLQGNPSFAYGDVEAEVDGLQHGAGFVLFVREGVLDFLEGYSYGEPWPTHINSFKVSYQHGAGRDFALLHAGRGWPAPWR